MKELRLSLKTKWFEMTGPDGKTEDYRCINEYWCKRFVDIYNSSVTTEQFIRFINNYKYYGFQDISALMRYYAIDFKTFDCNTMTLGYPSNSEVNKFKKYEHLGIEIGYGKEEWGAEPNKLYFIIKHGKQL